MLHPFYEYTVPRTLIVGGWLVFIAYWFVSAFFAKRSVRRRGRWFGAFAVRVELVIGFIVLVRFPWVRSHLRWQPALASFSPWIGAALTLAGIGLAVWARVHLGRNWGQPQTLRQDHELVTSGPYRRLRHPIYTGIILALLGTALACGSLLFILPVGVGAFFVYSIYVEERDMRAQFPDTYDAYCARTNRLVPFIW